MFLQASTAAIVSASSLVHAAQRPPFKVELPRMRVPLSFIIDDSTSLVNMGRFCMPQFATAWLPIAMSTIDLGKVGLRRYQTIFCVALRSGAHEHEGARQVLDGSPTLRASVGSIARSPAGLAVN